MSSQNKPNEKITVPKILQAYAAGEKLSMLTAYDYTMARMIDDAEIDMILVGDSLGMVVQGHTTTLPVSIDEMVYHTKCVAKGVRRSHIMADMPFMSYQVSEDRAVKNAGLLLKAGAESVKIEGGEEVTELVYYLNQIGIPVMAHIGLKPQSVNKMGGYKIQGKTKKEADAIIEDALMMEEAGAFSLLLEGVPTEVAQKITEQVSIPTIGIGSGPACSGQVLVIYDLLGANPDFKPKFVKNYANIYETTVNACRQYADEIRKGRFPSDAETVKQNLAVVKSGKKRLS